MFSLECCPRQLWAHCFDVIDEHYPECSLATGCARKAILSAKLNDNEIGVIQCYKTTRFPNNSMSGMPSIHSIDDGFMFVAYSKKCEGKVYDEDGCDITNQFSSDLLSDSTHVVCSRGLSNEETVSLANKALTYKRMPESPDIEHFVRPGHMTFHPSGRFEASKLRYYECDWRVSQSKRAYGVNISALMDVIQTYLDKKCRRHVKFNCLSELTVDFLRSINIEESVSDILTLSHSIGEDVEPIMMDTWMINCLRKVLETGDTEKAKEILENPSIDEHLRILTDKNIRCSRFDIKNAISGDCFMAPSALCNITPASISKWVSRGFSHVPGHTFDHTSMWRICTPIMSKGIYTVLVTGACGFIGANLCSSLLAHGYCVVGVDNMNDYYSVEHKVANLKQLQNNDNFFMHVCDIRDTKKMQKIIDLHSPVSGIVHLAAQAGVRYSLMYPSKVDSINRVGTRCVFDLAVDNSIGFVVYASSSSVYGEIEIQPCREDMQFGVVKSPYAVSKRTNERDAKDYCNEHNLTAVGLRFFTVGGPMLGGGIGRPDMALATFIQKLKNHSPITLYGDGSYKRDFTYVDDVVQGIRLSVEACLDGRIHGHEVFNIAEGQTTSVGKTILAIAQELSIIKTNKCPADMSDQETRDELEKMVNMGCLKIEENNPADVSSTFADITKAKEILGFSPKVGIFDSIRECVLMAHEVCRKPSAADVNYYPSEATAEKKLMISSKVIIETDKENVSINL